MNGSNVTIWAPESVWPSLEKRASLKGMVMVNAEGSLLYKAEIKAGSISGLINRHPTVLVSGFSCQIGERNIDALVAELPWNSLYKRTVVLTTDKRSREEARALLNQGTLRDYPLLSKICSDFAIHVPVKPENGTDRFVAAAYQHWPFMMIIHGLEPLFYATTKSLNHSGPKIL